MFKLLLSVSLTSDNTLYVAIPTVLQQSTETTENFQLKIKRIKKKEKYQIPRSPPPTPPLPTLEELKQNNENRILWSDLDYLVNYKPKETRDVCKTLTSRPF